MKQRPHWRRVLPLLCAVSYWSFADEIPKAQPQLDRSLFEVGAAVVAVYTPDYPASDQHHAKVLPLPYFIYRGNILRADREGARARLIRSQYANLEMSAAAAFSSRSRDNDARAGMPDLDYLFELGPRLSVPVSNLAGYGRLLLFIPVRAVFSTDFTDLHARGYTVTPAFYARMDHFYRPDWIWVSQLTANFMTRQLGSYFYDVAPEFATPMRPFYNAHGGYMGTDWFNGLAVPVGRRLRVFAGIQLWEFAGAANQSSPLFRRQFSYTSLAGLAYMFYESKRSAKTGLE